MIPGKWFARCCLLAVVILTTVFSACGSDQERATHIPTATESLPEELLVNGERRTFRLDVPASADDSLRRLVIVLHGLGASGAQIEDLADFRDEVGDDTLLVYPDGRLRVWPSAPPGTTGVAGELAVDDIHFIERLVDYAVDTYAVDRDSIYLVGFSNGAFFAPVLACALPGTFAGIALVAGMASSETVEACPAGGHTSYLAIHSLDDPVVPFDGGRLPAGFATLVPAEASAEHWALANGCDPTPDVRIVGDGVERIEYSRCETDKMVTLYRLAEAGHTWPDGATTWISNFIAGIELS